MTKRIELSRGVTVAVWDMEALANALKNGAKYATSLTTSFSGKLVRVYKDGNTIYGEAKSYKNDDVVTAKINDFEMRLGVSAKMFVPGTAVSVIVANPARVAEDDVVVGLSRVTAHKANRISGTVSECVLVDDEFEYRVRLENGSVISAGVDDVQELVEGVEYLTEDMSEYEIKHLLEYAIERRLEIIVDYQKINEDDTTRRCLEPIKVTSSRSGNSNYTLIALQIENFDSSDRKTDYRERKFYLSCIRRLVVSKNKYTYDPDIHDPN